MVMDPDHPRAPASNGSNSLPAAYTSGQWSRSDRSAAGILGTALVDSPHPTIVSDGSGRVVSMNDFAAILLQRQGESVHGLTVEEVLGFPLNPQSSQVDEAPPSSHLANAAQSTFSGRARRRDGTTIPVEVTCALLELGGKQVTIVHFCDVSARCLAETRTRQLSLALEQIADLAVITDTSGTVLYVNRAYEEATGFSRGAVVGTRADLSRLGKQNRDSYEELQSTLSAGAVYRGEFLSRTPRGDLHVYELRVAPFSDQESSDQFYIAIGRDVTDRHFRDTLTGLPTRAALLDRLTHALARAERSPGERQFALVFIDLDRFKSINVAHGKPLGDWVLIEMGRRIRKTVRRIDAVAQVSHLDRDEFAVLLEDLHSPEDVRLVAQRILDAIRSPLTLPDGSVIVVAASIGVAFPTSGHTTPEAVLQDAETAMRRAKATPEDPCQVFDLTMHERAQRRFHLETELRSGIRRDEFVLHYQPIVSLLTGKITSCEALVRWNHPTRGFVPPLDFIGIAEESGLIVQLGQLVLEKACQQASDWQALVACGLSVAVNVSTRQLADSHFVDTVKHTLATTRLPPHLLKVEVTESVATINPEATIAILSALRELGIELLIDDFGTGHSSLSRLTRFPLNKLKVDRSFVMQLPDSPHDNAVASAIVAMAQSLGLGVIAEGVETHQQASHLRLLGCEEMQGYLFSKPLPAAEFAQLIQSDRRLSLPGIVFE